MRNDEIANQFELDTAVRTLVCRTIGNGKVVCQVVDKGLVAMVSGAMRDLAG